MTSNRSQKKKTKKTWLGSQDRVWTATEQHYTSGDTSENISATKYEQQKVEKSHELQICG
jgi:hypothetical protein